MLVYKRPMECDVLVVGAGPTGLILAAELRRRGVDVLLIDTREEPQKWDRATVVHPRSLELFEGLGHLYFWEEPERFVRSVRDFLR